LLKQELELRQRYMFPVKRTILSPLESLGVSGDTLLSGGEESLRFEFADRFEDEE